MKVIFVAGPFKADNAWEIEQNIRRAEEVSLELWKLGFAVICPHSNSRFFFGACDEDIFLQGYKEILKRCDGVYIPFEYEESEGTIQEACIAIEYGIPAFTNLDEMIPYFKNAKDLDLMENKVVARIELARKRRTDK